MPKNNGEHWPIVNGHVAIACHELLLLEIVHKYSAIVRITSLHNGDMIASSETSWDIGYWERGQRSLIHMYNRYVRTYHLTRHQR